MSKPADRQDTSARAACLFVNDVASDAVLQRLAEGGVRFLVRCCAQWALRRRLLALAHGANLKAASCSGTGQGALGCAAQAMRCAGFDKVDLEAAARVGIRVARVPTSAPRCPAHPAAP